MAANNKVVARIQGDAPKIDFNQLPEHEKDQLCRTVIRAAKNAFKDPAVQEDYEKWKADRAARKQQADQLREVEACSSI